MKRVYPNIPQIYKETESGLLSMEEIELIQSVSPAYRWRFDRANGYIAFALQLVCESVDWLVDELNEKSEGWFVGYAEEEYVFID